MKQGKWLYKLISSAILVVILYGVWLGYVWYVSMPIYYFTKGPNSFTRNMYQADAQLGHTLQPNATAYFVWGHGDTVPMYIDERGFRTNGEQDRTGGLLFLGDSFTQCEELLVKQAYPFMVGNSLCQPVHNVAVSGYGYAQMILKARQHIAETDPEAVVFQVSPWLAERSINPYMPALFFKVPSPYYNSLGQLVGPYYTSPVFDLTQNNTLSHFANTSISFADKVDFVWNFTRLVFRHQYWQELKLLFTSHGEHRAVLNDTNKAKELALNEIISLTADRQLVLLVMGYGQESIYEFEEKFSHLLPSNVTLVNADEPLWAPPSISSKGEYEKAYCFWHGDPPVLIDYHFNAKANGIISDQLLQSLPQLSNCK